MDIDAAVEEKPFSDQLRNTINEKKGLKKEWNTWHKNTNATVLKMWLGIVKTTLENH